MCLRLDCVVPLMKAHAVGYTARKLVHETDNKQGMGPKVDLMDKSAAVMS